MKNFLLFIFKPAKQPQDKQNNGARANARKRICLINIFIGHLYIARNGRSAIDIGIREKEILNFIDQSTPHAYWLARSFIPLSDVYVAMDKKLDARQYLLSLQQNYQADDDIAGMIEERLEKLK